MVIFLGITIIISTFAIIDWKRTVLVWLPLCMLFNSCVCIRYAPPALTIVLAVNLVLIGVFLLRKNKMHGQLCNSKFLYAKSFRVYLISYFFSIVFSVVPFVTVFTGTVKYFINTFAIIYLFHKALKTSDDLRLFLKSALIIFIPIVLLGGYEAVFHDNPWLDIVYLSVPDIDYIRGKMYYIPPFLNYSGDLSMRFGMVRCFSFFNIHIYFGCACVLYLFLFLYFNQKGYHYGKSLSTMTYTSISILCILGIILSNSKTPMVGLPFLLLSAIPIKRFISPKGFLIGITVMIVVIMAISYNQDLFNNFTAIFDTKLQEEGGGSNVEMRATQYRVGLSLFMQNPIFGNGIDSLVYISKQSSKYDEILGSESSWLKILPQQGLLGIFAYIYMYKEMFIHLRESSSTNTAFFYLLGLIIMETATGFMDFHVYAPSVVAIERYKQICRARHPVLLKQQIIDV